MIPFRARAAAASALAALLLAGACRSSAPAGSAPAGTEPSEGCRAGAHDAEREARQSFTAGADTHELLIDAPASSVNEPRPLILAFHGFGSNAANVCDGTGLRTVAERERAVLVCPEGRDDVHLVGAVGRGWDVNPSETRDVDYVRALLDRLETERCIDRQRVYATGMSNGGFFASLLGCRLADRLAAIAPVAGVMPLKGCTPARPVPALLVFGRRDKVVPWALTEGGRNWWTETDGCGASQDVDGCFAFSGCRADVVACEGPQGHTWPADAAERIWRFFAAHPRG
ncbi:MAG TPA: PHB depolymerase family esterase [Candidatus Binatia bacterium]